MIGINFHKKGFEQGALVLLAFMVVLVVFLFIYLGQIKETSNRSVDVTACHSSVVRNARLHIRGLEFPSTLNCPAIKIEISDTGSDDAQLAAKKKIAEAMYDCWYKYGEGKLNLFTDEGVYCSVCSFIDVKDDEPIKGLPDYLINHDVPDGSGKDYASYLTGFSTSRAEDVVGAIRTDAAGAGLEEKVAGSLPGKSNYAALFVYAKGNDEIKRLINHLTLSRAESKIGVAAGGIFGGVVGGAVGGVAAATFFVIGAASGPPGWVIIGATAAIGVAIGAVAGWVESFFFTPNVPEWAAFTALREWNPGDTQGFLEGFGCEYFPAKLE